MKDLSRPEAAKAKSRQADSVSPARLTAFQILRRVDEGAYASILLAHTEDLKPVDRALCHELVMGVLRWQLWLDRLIEQYSNRRLASLDHAVASALRLGLYQLRFLTRIPASAAVNESVKLVRYARVRSAEGFVNAVLRRAVREPDVDPAAGASTGVSRLAIETSHPEWLIQRWIDAFGETQAKAFAVANNVAPRVAFRIVHSATEDDILDRLRRDGAILTPSRIARGAWRIANGGSLLHELAQSGQIYIQDEASQLVPQIVDAQPGERVLDVCSAPGGKTTQIAGAGSDIRVMAGDLHEHRIRTVRTAAVLQGIKNIQSVVLDAERPLPFPEHSFDRVLVDAPCSGTGTLRHNPEIRWRISAESIRKLESGQKRILLNASQMVRPGGRLIYSTCSVEAEENEAIVSAFLSSSDSFALLKLSGNPELVTREGFIRTWPHRDDTDGFFIAAFERKRSN